MKRRKAAISRPKRITLSDLAPEKDAAEVPLSQLVNFGPVTLREFHAMGLTVFGQLEKLGWEEVCRLWAQTFPERLNANAFIGVIATLDGIRWTEASASDRARARALVEHLKNEWGLLGPQSRRR